MMQRLVLGSQTFVIDAVEGESNVTITISSESREDWTFTISDLGCYLFAKALLMESSDGAHKPKKKGRKK